MFNELVIEFGIFLCYLFLRSFVQLDVPQDMTELFFLRAQIFAFLFRIRSHLEGNLLKKMETVALETDHLLRVIRE